MNRLDAGLVSSEAVFPAQAGMNRSTTPRPHIDGRVFPAQAGMNRFVASLSRDIARVPRAGGDEPT